SPAPGWPGDRRRTAWLTARQPRLRRARRLREAARVGWFRVLRAWLRVLRAPRQRRGRATSLILEIHNVVQNGVGNRYHAGGRLEAALGRDHVAELGREVDIGLLELAGLDRAQIPGAGGAQVRSQGGAGRGKIKKVVP